MTARYTSSSHGGKNIGQSPIYQRKNLFRAETVASAEQHAHNFCLIIYCVTVCTHCSVDFLPTHLFDAHLFTVYAVSGASVEMEQDQVPNKDSSQATGKHKECDVN